VKPRNRAESVAAAVGDLAGALRRRREAREPHVRVHDAQGRVRTLGAVDPRAQALLDAAEAMVDAVDARIREPAADSDAGADDAKP
jgi:hypothetical protein